MWRWLATDTEALVMKTCFLACMHALIGGFLPSYLLVMLVQHVVVAVVPCEVFPRGTLPVECHISVKACQINSVM